MSDYPHSLEAERAVLGAVLIDNDQAAGLIGTLHDRHFYRDAHQRIWRALVTLSERCSALDLVTLTEAMHASGDLEAAGGPAYLASLVDGVPHAMNVEHYAGIVREKAQRRTAIQIAASLTAAARGSDQAASAVVDGAIQELLAASRDTAAGDLVDGAALASGAMRWLDEQQRRRADKRLTGVPSGLRDLDRLTDGFQPGELVILAARPAQGKSAAALQFALAADGPVAFFSLEMSRDQLSARALATLGRIDGWAMRRGLLSTAEYGQLRVALERLGDSGLAIDESVDLSVPQMRAKARRWQQQHGLKMVVCDYLQLVTPSRGKGMRETNREQDVAGITRGLKALAKDLQVPVLALAQLNRATELARDKEPTLGNLRESGAVEQDADVVLFIHRPDGCSVAQEGPAKLIVAKNRTGPIGTVDLRWYPTCTRFDEPEQLSMGAA